MVVLAEGTGRLFTDPDPDRARDFFRKKSRKMANKLMSLKRALEEFVHDGDYLAIGGFGANRTPVAACHEIVRQGRKDMGFAGHTSTHDFQILAAGEVFSRVDIAYVVGLEARGLSRCARKYMESEEGEVTERIVVSELTAKVAQQMKSLSTVGGLRQFTSFPCILPAIVYAGCPKHANGEGVIVV